MLKSVNPLAQEITITVADLATAQREYDEHCAKCPGTHLEVYGKPDLERARQRWIEEKFRLKDRLDIAKAFSTSGWKREGNKLIAPVEVKSREPRIQPKKSLEEFVACYREKLAIMAAHEPRSPKWISARNSAYDYAHAIRERCKEEHLEVPFLEPVPIKPPLAPGLKKSQPRKPLTGNPRIDRRRERDRDRRAAQARNRSQVAP